MKTQSLTLGAGLIAMVAAVAGAALASADEPISPVAAVAEQRYEQLRAYLGQPCAIDADCPSPLRCPATECAEPPAIVGGADSDTPMVLFYAAQGEALYYLEVADDPRERQRGLMHRPSMLPDWGMIFVYPEEQPLSFWMQNTYIALDMVFIAADGTVVGVVENAEPLTTTSRAVEGSSQFVVELNAGQAAEHGIGAGVRAELLNLPADAISSSVGD